MIKIPLGKTGILVPPLCFGTLTVSPLQANLPHEAAGELLAYAFEQGITFLDTAQYYENYPHIRAGLERTQRDVVVATKTYAYDKAGAVAAVEEARRALGRDVIDIFLLHEQESIHTLRGHWEALETLWDYKARGIIRAVGISTHRVSGVRGAIEVGLDVIHPLINRVGYGIMDGTRQDMENALMDAASAGIGIYSMKSLAGGNLFREAEESLRYAFSLPYVQSRAIGMQSRDEVDANIHFAITGSFTEAQREALAAKRRRMIVEEECRGCGKCVARCGQNAVKLEMNTKKAVIDNKKCVMCGYCAKICPECAIKII